MLQICFSNEMCKNFGPETHSRTVNKGSIDTIKYRSLFWIYSINPMTFTFCFETTKNNKHELAMRQEYVFV